MSQSDVLVAGALFLFAPVPVWHLTLHSNLPRWRRSPGFFYAVCAMEWALFVPLCIYLARAFGPLFDPPDALKPVCLGVSLAGLAVAIWSIRALTPRRFFLWTVLHPGTGDAPWTASGPYRFLRHPAYIAIGMTMAAGFFATGDSVLLVATPAVSGALLLVTSLEEKELRVRESACKALGREGPFPSASPPL